MTAYVQRPEVAHALTKVPPMLARILSSRGVVSDGELDMSLASLIPPSELKGAVGAASFLADAVRDQKRLIVVADYDCDGATACTVAVRGLRTLGFQNVDFLVPNRFVDGYGLTPDIVDQVVARGQYDILVTVDNGIASIDGVAYANKCGLKVLVTDHHLPAEVPPAAEHIVNPSQHGCQFPSKALAGVGVMFYVLLALRTELRTRGIYTKETQPRLENLLDIVALGTVADVVKLDRNNRILVSAGLRLMRSGRGHEGIKALFTVCSRQIQVAVSTDLGFSIGPRINAAGRMDDMSVGIQCLLCDDPIKAIEMAEALQKLNTERRATEKTIQDEANGLLEGITISDSYTIALTGDKWHQGVIGIVAGRLKELHHRPTIIFAEFEKDGVKMLKGSGRSVEGFHLRDGLDMVSKRYPGVFVKFGGHAMAAGLTIYMDQFEAFKKGFEEAAREMMPAEALTHTIMHDGALSSDEMNLDLVYTLRDQVWGQGFPEPLFVTEFEVEHHKILAEKHMKLTLKPKGARSGGLSAIWFNNTELPGRTVRLAYKMDANTFRDETNLQLRIEGAI